LHYHFFLNLFFEKYISVWTDRVKQGIYGALRSVFSFSHNDTWVLWSDILPLMLFVTLAFVHLHSVHYNSLPPSAQLLEMGVFVGIIVLRMCSLAYHTFQSVSVWTLRRLLGLDQIGISMMTLVDPYFFLVGCHSSTGMLDPHPLDRPDFQLFLTVLLSTQLVTVAILLINMFLATPKQHQTLSQLTEPLLFLLAVIGNWPLLRIIIGSVPAPLILRCITFVAMMSTLCAYVFFFKMHMPEVYFPAGSSDGLCFSSYVLT
jgi:hypothetical protein